jgi:hypothetical protein
MKTTKQVGAEGRAASLKTGRAIALATLSSRPRAVQRLIRTILVPVDFSECSLSGLRYAIKFVREVGARVIVQHVTDSRSGHDDHRRRRV